MTGFISLKFIRILPLICLFLFISSCASFVPYKEKPTVGLKTFQLIPGDGLIPKFVIGLHIINPNRKPLKVEGLYYTVSIEGHQVLAGVANNLPEIRGYGEGDIPIEATVDLLNGAKLIRSLLVQPTSSFGYTFRAKLDMGTLMPTMNIVEKGQISVENL
jgi:LEA14-like dessication related protein